MTLSRNEIAAARAVYENYWDSYFKGNIEAFAATIDEAFSIIGTSEGETSFGKEAVVAMYEAQFEEIVGKAEVRNRQVREIPMGDMLQIIEFSDIYVLIDSEWKFYSKFRLSTLLHQTPDGWKLLQQHGSLPDMRVEEGETVAVERISKENLELRDAIKRRTIELENKSRELEIEAALERVRSRSMAMQNSDELQEVIKVVYEQLLHLNIKLDHAGFVVDYSPLGDWHFWIADDREIPSKITHPYFESVWANQFNEAKKNGETHFVTHLNFEEKNKFYNELLSHVSGLSETSKEFYLSCPGLAATTVLFDDVSLYIENFSGIPYKEEENQIVMRFGKIFQQAYTRFLDLQKAEAQAREAKIETALEKVRSRTMGMQKSEELADVAFVLFEQLRTLGGNLWGTGFGLCEKGSDGDSFWFANENGVFPPVSIPNTTDPAHQQMYKGWKAGKDYLVIEASGKELESHYNYMLSLTEVKPFFQKILDEGLSFPKWQKWNAAYFKQGYLLIITLEPYPDPHILKRFANVFDQTYTRFLDLQKAEAQAREAKIETALEKVRARTMGMQKSDELGDVADVLFQEMNNLVQNLWTCGFVLCEEDREEDEWWLSQENGFSHGLFLPNVNDYAHSHLYEGWLKKDDFRTVQLEGDDLQEHYDWLMEIPVAKKVFDDMEAAGMQRPEWQKLHAAYFSKGYLVIITREPCPEEDIFKRFAQVFDLTYTRFLDLQKAEGQAREAQIALSLERIRARVTGMQESSDLLDIVVTMRTEFVNLGHDAHYFWHMRWLPDVYKKAMTSGDGTKIGMVMTLPRHIHGDIEEVAAWEKTKDPIHVLAMDVDVAVHYVDKMISLGDFERVDPQAPTLDDIRQIGGLTFVMARTTHGEIGFSLPGVVPDPPKDAVDTLTRFAGVFDLAYRRFEDLKNAELQMRENRIELSLERIRGQVTAMQESSDLFDIVVGMRKEFISLGHESDYFWHMRWLPDVYEMSMTSEDGNRLGMVIQVPKAVHDQIEALAEWETSDDPIFVLPLDAKDAWDYLENMNTYGHYEKADPNAPAQEDIEHIGGLTFIIARTTHGEIGYSLPGMVPNPPKEALNTLMRFASVFDLAYKRFEDLKTAEKDLIEIKRARQKAEDALTELKATQSQLVQQEKLASLGQLTAGIAHEIKNPLNFVNNFSEVSVELVDEALEEIEKLEDSDVKEEIIEILNDVKGNLTKVHSHGSRADSIVKSMLQHSRGGSGKMEPTDINALIKEYVNLAFHGMRAGKNPINVDIQMDLDENIGKVDMIGEDFSRVILNLCNNAFDAMREKAKVREDYLPVLSVKTRLTANDQQIIAVSDNGPGIPDDLKDKILQPFFTTKKGTEGTGLGLSITNDIVKAHGGELQIQSESGKGLPAGQTGTTFTIHLKDQNV